MGNCDQGSRDWSDPSYLRRVAGRRTVPVELGGCYTGEGWRQELMTIADFITRFIETDDGGDNPDDDRAGLGKGEPEGEDKCLDKGVDGRCTEHRARKEPHEAKGKAYLAQHELFDQVPPLRRDILTPDYCALLLADEEDDGNAGSVATNAWFGPGGTVSPLHNDPFHNLLAQVVGTKRVSIADFRARCCCTSGSCFCFAARSFAAIARL